MELSRSLNSLNDAVTVVILIDIQIDKEKKKKRKKKGGKRNKHSSTTIHCLKILTDET